MLFQLSCNYQPPAKEEYKLTDADLRLYTEVSDDIIQGNSFPNLFIVSGPQGGGGSFNFTDAIDEHAEYIVWMLETMKEHDYTAVDVKKSSESEYAEHCRQADLVTRPLRDCISYYNGHGDSEAGSLAYYGGGYWHKFRRNAQETLAPYLFKENLP